MLSQSRSLLQRCMEGLFPLISRLLPAFRGLTSQEKCNGRVVAKSPDDRWEEVGNRALSLGHHVAEDHDVDLTIS